MPNIPATVCYESIGIIGVGLIGGSIGKAALARGVASEVVGIGRNPKRLKVALEQKAVTEISTDLDAIVGRRYCRRLHACKFHR